MEWNIVLLVTTHRDHPVDNSFTYYFVIFGLLPMVTILKKSKCYKVKWFYLNAFFYDGVFRFLFISTYVYIVVNVAITMQL